MNDTHIHFHFEGRTALEALTKAVQQMKELIMAALDDLRAKVEANTTVDQSAITLLQGLKAKLDAAIASGDPAQIKALSDALGVSNQALADAVTANTPAEPEPAP